MKFDRHAVLAILSALVLLLAHLSIAAGSPIKRATTNAAGAEANVGLCPVPGNPGLTACNVRSSYQSISADGRYVAFVSVSTNLVANDTNDTSDVFVKDRWTGAVVRASTASDGGQANLAHSSGFTGSHHPSISADGRYVTFESYASNLVPGDTNDRPDVFVKDLQTGAIVRILFNGSQGDYNTYAPVISANGRFVAFISLATNIYPDFGSTFRAYRYDLQTGEIRTVAGGQTTPSNRDFDVNAGASLAISSDGRYVTFGGKEIGFSWWRVIRRDLADNTLAVASVTNSGNSANGHSARANTLFEDQNIDMTPDGRYVVFTSDATNLDPGDPNTTRDVYLRDFQTLTTSLITRNASNQSLGLNSYNVSISADGRFVAFDDTSAAVGLSIRVLDRTYNFLRYAPYTITACCSGGGLLHPSIADNGRFLSFYSGRADLVPHDTNSSSGMQDVFVVDLLAAPSHRSHADFDGEAFADLSVFRPNDGNWYWLRSHNGALNVTHWGTNGDIPVAGDFDGDAKSDLVIFRPMNGAWYVLRSETGTVSIQSFGLNGDKPVAADYDGDEKTDIGVWRPSSGTFYIAHSGGGFRFQQWGLTTDRPVVGDFNGDGRADLAVFRPSDGNWFLCEDPAGLTLRAVRFGANGDRPAAGDYNGDGITDIAVYRPSTGAWYFLKSRRMLPQNPNPLQYDFSSVQWGIVEDLPVPGDFDGDGRADICVFRPSNGVWYQLRTGGSMQFQQFGVSADVPIAFASESN